MRKPYVQRQRADWWLRNPAYRRYMLREATALPLLFYTLLLMSGLYQFTRGEAAFLGWLELLRNPWLLALHGVALAAALFHAVTWIALVPKILVIDTDRLRVSPTVVKRLHQVGAVVCNVGLLLLVLLLVGGGR
ncbi:fumarate reductase subunit C [Kineobactrum sediminis]|uniref:Fumarate reductase subunit C n=1 Tax=Kineobactrum sediminis TaxID=1905677 RepID=A0A2N5Y7D6_9GAMM|nr:fumarate reductase subunit C [Kineobactrum sediminis]PLW84296.1 fumarate reductase subunit C [Kineobactrum sediminis]